MPLARTAFSKEDAAQLKKYAKDVDRILDSIVPWKKKERRKQTPLRSSLLAQGIKPGEVVVMFDSSDIRNDTLYKDAKAAN